MKPAVTTKRGSAAATCSARATSHAARSAKSAGRTTNVGMPARSARSSPVHGRSAPTAAMRTP